MKIKHGRGTTKFGPGVDIKLTGSEVAIAIYSYLTAHDIHVSGAATITVNGKMIKRGSVYVDPSGAVVAKGVKWDGKGESV